jgi:hypothetical protein
MLGMAEMIAAGITCVADHYFEMDQVARAVEQAGTRANLGWAVFGHQGYGSWKRRSVSWNAGRAKPMDASQPGWRRIHPICAIPSFWHAAPAKPPSSVVGNHIHASRLPDKSPCLWNATEKHQSNYCWMPVYWTSQPSLRIVFIPPTKISICWLAKKLASPGT